MTNCHLQHPLAPWMDVHPCIVMETPLPDNQLRDRDYNPPIEGCDRYVSIKAAFGKIFKNMLISRENKGVSRVGMMAKIKDFPAGVCADFI